MPAQSGHTGTWTLRRHYPKWIKITCSMTDHGNHRADCYAVDSDRWIGGAASNGSMADTEDAISKMLGDRRRFAHLTMDDCPRCEKRHRGDLCRLEATA